MGFSVVIILIYKLTFQITHILCLKSQIVPTCDTVPRWTVSYGSAPFMKNARDVIAMLLYTW